MPVRQPKTLNAGLAVSLAKVFAPRDDQIRRMARYLMATKGWTVEVFEVVCGLEKGRMSHYLNLSAMPVYVKRTIWLIFMLNCCPEVLRDPTDICTWGNTAEGLNVPQFLSDHELDLAIAKNNS